MRSLLRSLILACTAGLLLIASPGAAAPDEPKDLVEKGVKALGGADRLAKVKGLRIKGKGTIDIMGMTLDFTSDAVMDNNGRMKSEVMVEVMGQKFALIQVYDGKKGWMSLMGNVVEMEGDQLKELKEEIHSRRVNTLLPLLKDNGFTLATIGEAKVNGKPANGVKVSAKGFRDIDLYFDQASGLLVKTARQAYDTTTMKEVAQETLNSEFKDADGIKYATKAALQRDGKKFLDVEITEYKALETIDDSEFAKP